MASKSITLGLTLIALGVVVSVLSDSQSVTSYIPAFIGVVFVILGAVGSLKPGLNHHVMHAAAAVALISILSTLGRLIPTFADASGWAIFSQVAILVLCGGFLFFAIQSFKQARLAREAATA